MILTPPVGLAVLALPEDAALVLLVSVGAPGLGAVGRGDGGLQLRPLEEVPLRAFVRLKVLYGRSLFRRRTRAFLSLSFFFCTLPSWQNEQVPDLLPVL